MVISAILKKGIFMKQGNVDTDVEIPMTIENRNTKLR